MKKYDGFISGLRLGCPAAGYLPYALTRLLTVSSLYLALIVILPNVALDMGLGGANTGTGGTLGGTALLTLASVALTTVRQVEGQIT